MFCRPALRIACVVTFALGALTACEHGEPKRIAEPLPEALRPRVEQARAAAAELQKTLSGRLLSTMQEQGPVAAIEVCANEASTLTAQVGERHGVRIGRSSAKLRNAKNAPRDWVAMQLQALEGKTPVPGEAAVYDLGDRLGVALPLVAQPLCVTCHGPAESLAPPLRQALAARYPGDRATGYAAGDLRGVIWVELDQAR